jgi:hypothetical protein
MISTRRIVAAVGLAVGVSGLTAPLANAAVPAAGGLNPVSVLDSLAMSDIPAEHKGDVPPVSAQLAALNQLNQLQQVTGLVSPVTGLVPAVH